MPCYLMQIKKVYIIYLRMGECFHKIIAHNYLKLKPNNEDDRHSNSLNRIDITNNFFKTAKVTVN